MSCSLKIEALLHCNRYGAAKYQVDEVEKSGSIDDEGNRQGDNKLRDDTKGSVKKLLALIEIRRKYFKKLDLKVP